MLAFRAFVSRTSSMVLTPKCRESPFNKRHEPVNTSDLWETSPVLEPHQWAQTYQRWAFFLETGRPQSPLKHSHTKAKLVLFICTYDWLRRNSPSSSSSSSSAGFMTTGGWVGLGTWVSTLMVSLRCALAAGGWMEAGSSCLCSTFLPTSGRIRGWVLALPAASPSLVHALTFVWRNKHSVDVTGLLVEKGTVWLLTATGLVLPVTRNFLPVMLLECNNMEGNEQLIVYKKF